MKEYKVVSQRDNWFTGNFEPANIENGLNELAADGWRVITFTSVEATSWTGSREDALIILERDKA